MASIGRYEIEREIGRGSMGIVYLAHDPHVRRRVAVKTFLLPAGLTSEQEREYSARFLREAQAAGALSHPSIVTIFDADTDPEHGRPFIVMEYVEGGSLRDLMIRDQRLEPDRALAMASELADALRVAHEEGIVHRDIKPANVLLRKRDGQAKIVDFGVARMSTSELTGAGDVFGSPAYMSPEQFRGAAVDARSDLFSLATILYQTLCGERPFAGDDMSSLAYSVVHVPAPPLAPRLSGTPHEVDRFFEKALAKDPADRFADAGAFRDAVDELRRILSQQATIALNVREARLTFALPPLATPRLDALGRSARAMASKIRQTLAAPSGAPSGKGRRGIGALEGVFAFTMLVLAILPGLWALWSPAAPTASAQALPGLQGSAGLGGATDADADAGPPSTARARSASTVSERASRTASRAGAKAAPGSRSSSTSAASPSSAGLRGPQAAPPAAMAPSKSASPRGSRPGAPESGGARARTAWAPKGSAAPAPDPAAAQEGALASLASPMSRDPLARPVEVARANGYLVIDVRSLVKQGTVKILVDGREVYHRRLSSVENATAQTKLFHRREETFSARLEVAPGTHTVAAQVFTDGKDDGREDATDVSVQARETAHLQLVAGRILGASVSLTRD